MIRLSIIVALSGFLVACGYNSSSPSPGPYIPAPQPVDQAWLAIKPIVDRVCGPCHNGVQQPQFSSGTVFKGSAAKARLTAGTMPPQGAISASDKQALLNYLGG